MSLYVPAGRRIRLRPEPLGSGAEGDIFRLTDTDDLCAKLYLTPAPAVRDRLEALMRLPIATWGGDNREHLHAAWPASVLVDDAGDSRGFLMPLIDGMPTNMLFDSRLRLEALAEPTWRTMIAVAARIARLFAMLHRDGIVIGDVSPTNVIVARSGHVTLIDCDTIQFTEPSTARRYPHTKVTPEYSPPESSGGQVLEPSHDVFGLAIMTCQLLMNGQHPFEGVPSNPSVDSDLTWDNIRMQNNRITHPERLVNIAGSLPPSVLPPRVLQLAQSAFGAGHTDPGSRPSAADWAAALDQAGFELMGCHLNHRHLYHRSLPNCIWCAQIAAGFADPYPAARQPAGQAAFQGATVPVATAAPPRPAVSPYPPPPAPSRTAPTRPVPAPPPPPPISRPDPFRPAPPSPTPARSGTGGGGAGGAVAVVVALIVIVLIIAALVH